MSYLPKQDVGNVVMMEHVNLEVDDLEVARLFYAEGLGLVQVRKRDLPRNSQSASDSDAPASELDAPANSDPSTLGCERGGLNVLWFNIGRQQFHISKGACAQTIGPGAVLGLVLPNLDDITSRLQAVKECLGPKAGSLDCRHAGSNLHVTDPYGNHFVVHSYLPAFPSTHGIAHINLPCHVGTSGSISGFYREVLGAIVVRLDREVTEDGSRLLGAQAEGVAVVVGPGMLLIFVEDPQLGEVEDGAISSRYSGWHLALYVCNFSGVYERLERLGLILNSHPYRDKCHSLEEALANRQLRFQDILLVNDTLMAGLRSSTTTTPSQLADQLADGCNTDDGDDGGEGQSNGVGGPEGDEAKAGSRKLAFQLQHEVRSLHHAQFMKNLYNRTY